MIITFMSDNCKSVLGMCSSGDQEEDLIPQVEDDSEDMITQAADVANKNTCQVGNQVLSHSFQICVDFHSL